MVALLPEGAGAARADPVAAALVPALLLLHALFEHLLERLHVDRLEGRELLVAEVLAVRRILQPLLELLDELDALRAHALKCERKASSNLSRSLSRCTQMARATW